MSGKDVNWFIASLIIAWLQPAVQSSLDAASICVQGNAW